VVAVPGADHLPWEGVQDDVLDAIEDFLEHAREATVEPDRILTTVLEVTAPDADRGVMLGALARFRGHALDAPPGHLRASFDGPARAVRCASALMDSVPGMCAGVHTGECELHQGRLSGPALEIAQAAVGAAAPGEVLTTSTVHDLVAGSRIEFVERGVIAAAARQWRLFGVVR
jgi:class 3 adenylate cyclase